MRPAKCSEAFSSANISASEKHQNTGAVEGGDRRVGPVQAELLLQPPHVHDAQTDKPFGLGAVWMIDLD